MRIDRKWVAFGLLVLAGCRRSGPSTTAAAARPSIVLISLDTVRPDHLGCGGSRRPTSPNLDKFALRAAWFAQARSQAPWTLPSHMSLFTSLLPSHNGVEDIGQRLPANVPTLPELLQRAGYHTAAFVNNAQMKPHWGFARGFDEWHEFEVDEPEGQAGPITDQALAWLAAKPAHPFFLFLHYYDAHDPYDPPPAFRERFGVTLSAEAIHRAVWDYHQPGRDLPDPAVLDQVRAAYDAEIAALDAELGRLLAALPRDALVVVFSDHGEAFKEHGWTTHGATLYEEEIRCVLLVRPPGGLAPARVVPDPVMLLDVAPTILGYAGVAPPPACEGIDLRPAVGARALPARPQFAETKRVLEGRFLKAVIEAPQKLIYRVPDGRLEAYRLPDEQNPLAATNLSPALTGELRRWMQAEQYWLVRFGGPGRYRLTVMVPDGRIGLFIPFGLDLETEAFQPSEDGRELSWEGTPGAAGKCLLIQPLPAHAPLRIAVATGPDAVLATNVFVASGPGSWAPATDNPVLVGAAVYAADPMITNAVAPPFPGVFISRHRNPAVAAGGLPRAPVTLDDRTREQLRKLGYTR